MGKFLILKPFMQTLAEGKTFKNFFYWFLRILAVLTLLVFIYLSVKLWANIPFSGIKASFIIFALLAQVLFAFLVFVICNILLIRADDFKTLNTSQDYILIPIAVRFIRMTGEITGVFYAFIGIFAGIAIWTVGPMMRFFSSEIPGMDLFSGNTGVAGGFIAIIGGPLFGFMALCLQYLIAEILQILADYFRNTGR